MWPFQLNLRPQEELDPEGLFGEQRTSRGAESQHLVHGLLILDAAA